jgi:DNA-binding response OmpR family regulator
MSQAPTQEKQLTVLVVDDEEDLRDIMHRILKRNGFAPLTAGDVAPAIELCREHPGVIDILVTDLTLPGGSGTELSRAAVEMRPGIRVVYISGLPKELAVQEGLIAPDSLLVKKPFSSADLLAALNS